ncbi:hypothetical protein [Chitinibacter sp. S2-10]|uniref:ArnT family glycosyltransferase n=1 Tax=Chitinibacter sp. S2-10 TaxID=3373597 RepID=UPI003977C137
MLTYTPESERPASSLKEQDKPWLLILLCLFWLLPGLFGHDPWKPQENENAALIASLLRQDSWVIPWLADRPYFETAPLYFWVAALFANALAWFGVAIHDAARLSTGFWMALSLWGVGLAGRELFGHRYGRLTVVLVMGSLGLVLWSRHIAPAALVFAAYSWAFYALVHSLKKPLLSGLMLGLSLLGLLLGANWADALLVLLMAVGLGLSRHWRKQAYLVTLVSALIVAVPLAALWGYALHSESPQLFYAWRQFYAWGPYGGSKTILWFHQPGFLLSTLLWFAWPVLPLALWSLWVNRRELAKHPRWFLLLWLMGTLIVYIVCAGSPNETTVLPLLLVFSLIAAAGIDELKHGAAAALNSFSILTFGLSAIVLWLVWLMLILGAPDSDIFRQFSRVSTIPFTVHAIGLIFSIVASILWGSILLRRRAMGRKALTNWTCSLILLLSVFVGLFQNWVDTGKSYRPVASQVQTLADTLQPNCLDASEMSSELIGAMVYFTTLKIKTTTNNDCSMAIRSGLDFAKEDWHLMDKTQRRGESKEQIYIFQK